MGKRRLLATQDRHYRIHLIVLHLLGSTPTLLEATGHRYERRKRENGNGFHAQTATPSNLGPALLDSSHRRKRENGNGFHAQTALPSDSGPALSDSSHRPSSFMIDADVTGSQGTPLRAILCRHGYLYYFFNFLIVGSYNFNHICQKSFISILLWSKYISLKILPCSLSSEDTAMFIYTPPNYL